jgi:hypothetical protein
MTSNVVLLDNLLAQYGPETNDVRNLLRRGIVVLADRMWREKSSEVAKATPFEASAASDAFFAKLQQLSPRNDSQRSLQARAIQITTDIAQARLLLSGSSQTQTAWTLLPFGLRASRQKDHPLYPRWATPGSATSTDHL